MSVFLSSTASKHLSRGACFSRGVRSTLTGIGIFLGLAGWTGVGTGGLLVAAPSISWNKGDGYRWRELAPAGDEGQPGFTRLGGEQTGLQFTNTLSEMDGALNRVLYNGSGVAVGDYDGDGYPDLYFCGLNTSNVLYRNLGGLRFEAVADNAGVDFPDAFGRGAVFADINGDRWDDLLVSTLDQGVRCYLNDGHGRFKDVTAQAGTRSDAGSTSLALADIDGNGTLDLYITNYRPTDIRDQGEVTMRVVDGRVIPPPEYADRLTVIQGAIYEFGQPDQLLLNDGGGRFTPVQWESGAFLDESGAALTGPPRDWGLTATFRDINQDGLPDIYVCNDYWTPDRFWINQGRGRFRAIETVGLRNTSASSMGIDIADYDRDGDPDIFVLDMFSRDPRLRIRQKLAQMPPPNEIGVIANRPQVMRNTLQENRGDATFREVGWEAGVVAADWAWSTVFLDVDLDGFEDLLIAAGHFKDVQDMDANMLIKTRQTPRDSSLSAAERRRRFTRELLEHHRLYPRLDMPVVAYHNRGDGTFEETTASWGTGEAGVHHSLAYGDFDLDGDLDLVTNNLETQAGFYRNDSVKPRVAVRLRGLAPNTAGIGAKVSLITDSLPVQSQEVVSGGRYLAGCEPVFSFATGKAADSMRIEVTWRSGRTSVVTAVRPNALYEINEPEHPATTTLEAAQPSAAPFVDLSGALSHTHQESSFDDFNLQPLLPFRQSQAGPGLAWFDVNQDGHPDLISGNGRGAPLEVFLGDGQGGFKRVSSAPEWVAPDDITMCLGYHPTPASTGILVAVSGYEEPGQAAVFHATLLNGRIKVEPLLSGLPGSVGPIALGDMDADGDLDLFVGGGPRPGHYPEGSGSRIYLRSGNRWELDTGNSRILAETGIVNSALWSDVAGDFLPELILACEWGPVRVYQLRGNLLQEITVPLGLGATIGWWRSVATADLNSDGRLDIVAGNWGRNSPFQASPAKPVRLLYGDWMGADRYELLETDYIPGSNDLIPTRDFNSLVPSLPFLYERYRSFRQFSESPVQVLLGEFSKQTFMAAATTLDSMAFISGQDRFMPTPLPRAAQLTPVSGLAVADADGDGHEDVFLSQNFFPMRAELARQDAGRGLWLRGDGTGALAEVAGNDWGIEVYGDQRGAALADLDSDGLIDLAVAQNGHETRLFQGRAGAPAWRIQLQGPPANPAAIGAQLRLENDKRKGPVREIQAGSGYRSQHSAIQLMGPTGQFNRIWIRWPDGTETTHPLDPSERQVQFKR
ncbi:MAG: FG-GAP-like repeat-containing protein [Limisphaerales bacterium]|jgi:hypothetical protein